MLLYGHLDKQPEMVGWRDDFGPWTPVIEDGRLYGRGGADDGYAIFAALSAIGALPAQGVRARALRRHDRDVRGERQLRPARVPRRAAPRLGDVDFVVGLDSGCGDYERLWMTTSLRGLAAGTLTVEVLTEGVHSGRCERRRAVVVSHRAQAARPSRGCGQPAGSCRRRSTSQIPPERVEQAGAAAAILGDIVFRKYPFAPARGRWSTTRRKRC